MVAVQAITVFATPAAYSRHRVGQSNAKNLTNPLSGNIKDSGYVTIRSAL